MIVLLDQLVYGAVGLNGSTGPTGPVGSSFIGSLGDTGSLTRLYFRITNKWFSILVPLYQK
jgi:hypothetical protein